MNKLQVVIQGSTYNIVTEKSKEETDKIVKKINEDIEGCKARNSKLTTLNATILALMNLAETHDNLSIEFNDYKRKYNPIIKDYSNLKSDCEKLYKDLVIKETNLKQITKQLNETKENSQKEINEIKRKAEIYSNEIKEQFEQKEKDLNQKLKADKDNTDDLKKQIEFYETENDQLSQKYKDLKDEYNKLAFEKNKLENILMDYQRDEIID
ncbi:MAG: cell division protein ZapA [Finegoldia sp.]|uniref:cell division protein ZapA n=1 Tax=Finegoldia sp. TaxID=1981334 RepID=UPI0025F74B50|nr:cell division protein ZapA [uncultured Finegoldia sp.]MDU1833060.1 cell division protein ZapA [Finegoldia magna]MDU1877973.1 cell division protein ZapA [Finegoldia magna]